MSQVESVGRSSHSDTQSDTRLGTTADGRTISYAEYGDPAGVPVFYAHGGPGSRLEGALFHDSAARHGFRIIATDRPGMGQSTFQPGRKLLDYPRDIAHLADTLGIARFGVMGWSGGGAHTTVCGYAFPERLLFNIPLCGYTNWAELPGAATMLEAPADRVAIGLSHKHPRLFRAFFDLMAFAIKYTPNLYYRELVQRGNHADQRIAADPQFKAHFVADQREAMAHGGQGVTVDALVHYVDWGFRLREIPGRVHVFHGTEDRSVPVAYAHHLAANIPNCELHLLEGEGHLFPATHQDLIFETAQAEL